jgi:flagellar hook-associated protein 3 FlgL
MSLSSVSNLSITKSLTSELQAEQTTLTLLTSQLSSQKKYANLTDYSPSEARNLINLQATATQKNAYISVIATVTNNLAIYDTTLTDLESIASQALSLANNNPTYGADIAVNVATQSTNYLKSVTVDLNQSINGRFIYSGSRYSTLPVTDLSTLPMSTLDTTFYTDDLTLPSYDSEFVEGAGSTSVPAYTIDQATVNTGFVCNYGITSNDLSFQKLIAGLRYLKAAGDSTDSTTYKSNMTQASTLLSSALFELQSLHTSVVNNINTMSNLKTAQNAALADLTDQVGNIQQVDVTQIAAEITSLQTILQASYSVTGTILKMSIVNFL